MPDMGIKVSILSLGSRGIPLIPSWTEYIRNDSIPTLEVKEKSKINLTLKSFLSIIFNNLNFFDKNMS